MTTTTKTPEQIGAEIGQAIYRTCVSEGITCTWTGIEAQDADRMEALGLVMGSAEWSRAEDAAAKEFATLSTR